jgi:hypothetical protein
MPSERIANDIRGSLVAGVRFEDFAHMFDTMMLLRRPYHPKGLRSSEEIAGRLLCIAFPAKPAKYMNAMQKFRLGFKGVATRPGLQAEFSNSVRQAAISMSRIEQIEWIPSLYFAPPPRLRNLAGWY